MHASTKIYLIKSIDGSVKLHGADFGKIEFQNQLTPNRYLINQNIILDNKKNYKHFPEFGNSFKNLFNFTN